jgi:hypothetical protein
VTEAFTFRRVAARPGKAGDQTKLDRVFADAEDNRHRGGCSFGRKRSGITARRSDNRHATDEVSHERRQPVVLAVQPVVLWSAPLGVDRWGT